MISPRKIISCYRTILAHDFSSVQCPLPQKISEAIYQWGIKNIPEEILGEEGRETDIHVTCKYGLHYHDPVEMKELIVSIDPVKITLGQMSLFENDQDVLKIEIDSPDLIRLNKLICERFEYTDTHPKYIPHCTISYLKKGTGKPYVGRKDFAGRKIILPAVEFSGNDNRKTLIPFKMP